MSLRQICELLQYAYVLFDYAVDTMIVLSPPVFNKLLAFTLDSG